MPLRTAFLFALLLVPRVALAQQPADPCQRPVAAEGTAAKPVTALAAMKAAASPGCVGWLEDPAAGRPLSMPVVPSGDASRAFGAVALPGAGILANELFSVIAEIAVERAQRQGLAIVQETIADGVCNLQFEIPPAVANDAVLNLRLAETCALIRTTNLLALVGQGRALRTALTSDVLSAADVVVVDRMRDLPPLARSAAAAIVLAKRVASDPQAHLTKNDVWLVTDAFLNARWPATAANPVHLRTLQIALASARIYVEALSNTTEKDRVDLAEALRLVIRQQCPGPAACPFEDPAVAKRLTEWTNLAVKAATAMSADGGTEDFRTRLRSSVQLVFTAFRTITEAAPGDLAKQLADLPARRFTFPLWAETLTLAAIDGDAPQLIGALAQLASEAALNDCADECAEKRKVAALLTGISTYAISYQEIPAGADAPTRAALLQEQRDARRTALESVIDAATDRRGRGGKWVWALGTGVGVTLVGGQRLDAPAASAASRTKDTFVGQLHVPVGVSLQLLPSTWWLGFHTMLSVLDLGNYVGKTGEPDSTPDWQAIIAPGVQIGLPIGTASNFVVLGLNVGYAPRFVAADTNGATTPRSALRYGIFAHYFVPLWDLN